MISDRKAQILRTTTAASDMSARLSQYYFSYIFVSISPLRQVLLSLVFASRAVCVCLCLVHLVPVRSVLIVFTCSLNVY